MKAAPPSLREQIRVGVVQRLQPFGLPRDVGRLMASLLRLLPGLVRPGLFGRRSILVQGRFTSQGRCFGVGELRGGRSSL